MLNSSQSHCAEDDKKNVADDINVSQHISNAMLTAECTLHNQLRPFVGIPCHKKHC